jgi:uncharacterized protein YabN with tetrapyrrole methylase and pyrophosphatase domain
VDLLEEISDKLVRRHPHVFGDVTARRIRPPFLKLGCHQAAGKSRQNDSTTSDDDSVLSGVPRALPSLALAMEISKKAAKPVSNGPMCWP